MAGTTRERRGAARNWVVGPRSPRFRARSTRFEGELFGSGISSNDATFYDVLFERSGPKGRCKKESAGGDSKRSERKAA